MIKLDLTKMYYLSHPCTSVGTMAENGRLDVSTIEKNFILSAKPTNPRKRDGQDTPLSDILVSPK